MEYIIWTLTYHTALSALDVLYACWTYRQCFSSRVDRGVKSDEPKSCSLPAHIEREGERENKKEERDVKICQRERNNECAAAQCEHYSRCRQSQTGRKRQQPQAGNISDEEEAAAPWIKERGEGVWRYQRSGLKG